MKQKTIKPGDTQPDPCPNCEEFCGYQISDYLKTHYFTQYFPDGRHQGGCYSDYQPVIHQAKTCSCTQCGQKLPFKIDRSDGEEVANPGTFKKGARFIS